MHSIIPMQPPEVLQPIRFGPAQGQVLSPQEHSALVKHLFNMVARSEHELQQRRAHMQATELDLLGVVVPTGNDVDRAQKRSEGASVSIPDAIYPFGWFVLQQFCSELASVVMPVENPYAVVADASKQAFANKMAKAFRHQGVMFDHRNNVHAALFDMIALNCGVLEMRWESISRAGVSNSMATTGMVVPGSVSGLKIRHLDPYNVFWDNTVPLPEVAEQGEYFGVFETVSPYMLRRMADKGRNFLHPRLLKEFADRVARKETQTHGPAAQHGYEINGWLRCDSENSLLWPHYHPKIASARSTAHRLWGSRQYVETSFTGLFSRLDEPAGDYNNISVQDRVHLTRMYVRLKSSEWGLAPKITNAAARAEEPFTLWEIHLAGPGVISYAAPVRAQLDRMPIAIGDMNFDRGFDRGFQHGTQAAQLGLLASTIMNMHKRAMRKGIEGGLTIYDSETIPLDRVDDMTGGKLPVSQLKSGERLSDRVLQLSDVPDTQNNMRDAVQINDFMRGLFPTNSQPAMAGLDRATTYQAQAVLMTGQRALMFYAAVADGMLMVPVRYHLQFETIQNRPTMDYIDEQTNALLEVAATEIGETRFLLTQSQPLIGIDRLRATTELRDLINLTLQSGGQLPPIAQFYMKHYMEMSAFPIDMAEYEKVLAEQMAYEQAQAAQAAAGPPSAGAATRPGAPPRAQVPV
jgi:hypothetical protein